MKKRIISLVLALVMCLSLCTTAFADTVSPLRIGENRQLNVPLYQQQTDYTCGPACIRMAIRKFGYTVAESEIARRAGTNENVGTYVYKVAQTLNSYLGNKYAYYATYETDFVSKVIESITAGYPVICHTAPSVLPNYRNQHAPDGHYVIIKGYTIQTGATTQISVTYHDPNYDEQTYGTFTTYASVMEQAIDNNSCYFIAY